MKPHKHAELIKAWADGAIIEKNNGLGHWIETNHPDWMSWEIYRIKPEPKPDYRRWFVFHKDRPCIYPHSKEELANLVLIFDGETDELKSAKVLT
jgi:hypothetical protein